MHHNKLVSDISWLVVHFFQIAFFSSMVHQGSVRIRHCILFSLGNILQAVLITLSAWVLLHTSIYFYAWHLGLLYPCLNTGTSSKRIFPAFWTLSWTEFLTGFPIMLEEREGFPIKAKHTFPPYKPLPHLRVKYFRSHFLATIIIPLNLLHWKHCLLPRPSRFHHQWQEPV